MFELHVSRITKINYRGTKKHDVTVAAVDGTAENSTGRRLSRVLIAGTPTRLDAGTPPAVKAAPSKRRNFPEFTCRVRVRSAHVHSRIAALTSSGIAHSGAI